LYCFPRWHKEGQLRNDSASAAVNKFLKSTNTKGTSHSFRHTMKSRLSEAGVNQYEQENFLGWSNNKMINHYGKIDSLKTLRQALQKLTDHEGAGDSKYNTY